MKIAKKVMSLLICVCMLMQLCTLSAFGNDEVANYQHYLYDIPPATTGETVYYKNVDSNIKDVNALFSLLYNSDYYDGEGWNYRQPSTITFYNMSNDKMWNIEQTTYPLKCINEYRVEDDKIVKRGQFDLTFDIPKELESGTYEVTVKLYVPEGKEILSIVKPTHFVIEKLEIISTTPIPGGGGGHNPDDEVKDSDIIFNVADTTNLEPVSGAQITITDELGTINKQIASDSQGRASVDLPNGKYNVRIIASGYEVRMFTIEKTDEKYEFSPYLNKNPLVKVETSVKEMTRQEMIDAGIDVNAAENKHIYKCVSVFKFEPVIGDGSVDITPIEINFDYVCDETGTIIQAKPVRQDGMFIQPVAKDVYLIIHSEVTWLKEIFDVQLVVANTSVIETIKDCEINLNLPAGLSLATMADEEQSLTVDFAEIAPLATEDVHWYVCGDEKGEYLIDGSITGTRDDGNGITEAMNASFTMQEPITVLAGEAMTLLIEAERYAVSGMPYRVNYMLTNVSDKTLYDVVLDVIGGKFREAYSIEEIKHNGDLVNLDGLTGTFNNGYELKSEEFKPGDVLSGVFEIIFGQGIETDYIEYMVSEMFTFTGAGSTTTIPTDITLVDAVPGISTQKNGDELEYIILDESIDEFLADVPETGKAVIDVTGDSINNLVLPSNIIETFDENEEVESFTVVADAAEISMDKNVLHTLAEKMQADDKIRINLEIVDATTLSDLQQAAIIAISEDAKVVQLKIDIIHNEETESVHELNGNVDVSIPYTLPESMTNKRFVVFYVAEDGSIDYITAEYADGFVSFTTDHFSHYATAVIDCSHEWDSGEIITPATTSSTGLMLYTCNLCSGTKNEVIPQIVVSYGGGGSASTSCTIKFDTDGGSKIGNLKVKKNELLTMPDAPEKSGYTFAGWYTDSKLTKEYNFSEKVTKSFTLYAKWEEKTFDDIQNDAWYKDAVKFVSDKGLMNGISETEFAPDATMTRSMFVTMLYRLENEPDAAGKTFADVTEGSWYEKAVNWATENNIVNGVSETEFAPDSTITREQMSTILYRYAEFKGFDVKTDEKANYTDSDKISEYAKNAIFWATAKGIMTGNDDGSFGPRNSATRAQAAAVFMRIIENLK